MAKGKEAKEKLYKTTREKGVCFYDKKGSGYMKDGKKNTIDAYILCNYILRS
ncbi:MAG: hypothetical protein CM15mV28_1430 [Thaumasvirus sp.]|nr:MAG: hypothetical protein CM15mV28_1430 [Thaumasvirus sp.]